MSLHVHSPEIFRCRQGGAEPGEAKFLATFLARRRNCFEGACAVKRHRATQPCNHGGFAKSWLACASGFGGPQTLSQSEFMALSISACCETLGLGFNLQDSEREVKVQSPSKLNQPGTRMGRWEFPKIRGTIFWGPYNKDPILGSPIFGNSQMFLRLKTPMMHQTMGAAWVVATLSLHESRRRQGGQCPAGNKSQGQMTMLLLMMMLMMMMMLAQMAPAGKAQYG